MSEPVNSIQTKCADCGQSLRKVTGTRCPRCFGPLPVSTTTKYLQTHKPRNAAGNKAAAIAVPTKLSPQNPNLIECADCGKAISKRAASCPHCGSPVENSTAATASGDAVDACCAESNVNCSDSEQETGMEPVLDMIKHDVTKLQRIAKTLEGIDV